MVPTLNPAPGTSHGCTHIDTAPPGPAHRHHRPESAANGTSSCTRITSTTARSGFNGECFFFIACTLGTMCAVSFFSIFTHLVRHFPPPITSILIVFICNIVLHHQAFQQQWLVRWVEPWNDRGTDPRVHQRPVHRKSAHFAPPVAQQKPETTWGQPSGCADMPRTTGSEDPEGKLFSFSILLCCLVCCVIFSVFLRTLCHNSRRRCLFSPDLLHFI